MTMLAKAALALSAVLLLSSCLFAPRTPVLPPYGFAANFTSFPVDLTYEQNTIGPKSGSSASTAILGLVSIGSASVEDAARAGGITRVNHIDAKATNILFVYSRYEIVAYGE